LEIQVDFASYLELLALAKVAFKG